MEGLSFNAELWMEDNTGGGMCPFCGLRDECPRTMACYGGEPVFPLCADNPIEDYLDWDTIEETYPYSENPEYWV